MRDGEIGERRTSASIALGLQAWSNPDGDRKLTPMLASAIRCAHAYCRALAVSRGIRNTHSLPPINPPCIRFQRV